MTVLMTVLITMSARASSTKAAEELEGFAAVLRSGATCTGSLRGNGQEPTPFPPDEIGSSIS